MKKFLFTRALAAKKKFFSLLAIFIACSTFSPLRANEVTIPDPTSGTALTTTTYLPIAINTITTATSCAYHSVSQQLYYASELNNNSVTPSTNTIRAITFDYQSGTNFDGDKARKLQVWMKMTSIDNFDTEESETPHMVAPGIKVFSGNVELKSDNNTGKNGKPYTITFDTPFEWDGSSNIIVTVQDTTGTRNTASTFGGVGSTDRSVQPGATSMFADVGKVRFLHKTCTTAVASEAKGWDINSLHLATATKSTVANRKYVNKITFVFAPAPETAPATPSDLAVSSTTANSATLSWSAVEGATLYNLEQSTDNSNWSSLSTGETGTSYTWTGLSPESTRHVRICAINANGSSGWSDAVTVTTDAVHSHNGIEFDKWSSTNSLPTSGNYYLENDVTLDRYDPQTITLIGNLNLCLNGNTANLYGTKIVVPDDKTLTIYDNVGNGKLTGFVLSEAGLENYSSALIVVKGGGTLVLKEGTIENTYIPDDDGDCYAIYSNGTINLSGDVNIISETADIYLYASKVITISGALSNAEKHTVYRANGAFTSGWSTYMSGENPANFFSATDASHAVVLEDGEAKLASALTFSDIADNSSAIESGINQGVSKVITISRSFTSASYNTICLPFALSDEQLQEVFGAGYDLQSFQSADLDEETGETLLLEFSKVTSLSSGVPYLIKPSIHVVSPTFYGVTIPSEHSATPAAQTSTYIDFQGVYSPTELEGGNKNLLFLGAGNELFWPEATGNLNGFRAYFEVKGAAQKVAKRARIVQKDNTATGIEEVQRGDVQCTKVLRDGQLYLMYEGKMYDVRGQRVR